MDLSLLLPHISKHIQLDESESHYLESILIARCLAKKEFLLTQRSSCNHIYFVNSGLLRAFHISTQGKDSTIMFATEQWWITDMHCFVKALPAMVNIQAVQNCELLALSKSNLDKLFEHIPAFERYFRILMENAYSREQLRMVQNLSAPAKERYETFLSKYPQIAQHVTQKQIASYLGITPEFLSTIRAEKG